MVLPDRNEIEGVLATVAAQARAYLGQVDARPALHPDAEAAVRRFAASLPDEGDGAVAALNQLWEHGLDATLASSGPRCFHFVIGGVTPAALGADLLATVLDQPAYT